MLAIFDSLKKVPWAQAQRKINMMSFLKTTPTYLHHKQEKSWFVLNWKTRAVKLDLMSIDSIHVICSKINFKCKFYLKQQFINFIG